MGASSVNSFFVQEPVVGNGPKRWRIKGSGVRGYPSDAARTKAVIQILKDSGISVREYTMESPINVDSHHAEASFLDGGLYAATGNYWYEERGAWINGEKAFKFVTDILGLVAKKAISRKSSPTNSEGNIDT